MRLGHHDYLEYWVLIKLSCQPNKIELVRSLMKLQTNLKIYVETRSNLFANVDRL